MAVKHDIAVKNYLAVNHVAAEHHGVAAPVNLNLGTKSDDKFGNKRSMIANKVIQFYEIIKQIIKRN